MGRLSVLVLAGLTLGAQPAGAADPPQMGAASVLSALDCWRDLIAEASARFEIPEAWIRAVMRAESAGIAFVDGQPIASPAGAIGLMQVMPATYAALRLRHGLGSDPADPRDNILAGTAYLRELYERYGYPTLFAAYNAGPGRLDAYRQVGRSLPNETRAYLAAVSGAEDGPMRTTFAASEAGLFFALRTAGTLGATKRPPASGGLFVPLQTIP